MTIAEIVERSGVPSATVHHYRRLGLLPAPQRVAANRFLYDERHVRALRLIRALRERRRLGLDEIRRILPQLLGLSGEEAFRPEMWDQAVGLHQRTARSRDAGTRLLDAGRRAFVRRGFADVRVDDVCNAARVAKGSFYRYYRSKDDLYFAACARTTEDLVAELERRAGGRRLADDEVVGLLATLLQPVLSLYLDLLARAFQRQPGCMRAVRQSFDDVEQAVDRHLRHRGPAADRRASRIVDAAVRRVVTDTVRGGSITATPSVDRTP
jgi:AcrR family transcriptional regulator